MDGISTCRKRPCQEKLVITVDLIARIACCDLGFDRLTKTSRRESGAIEVSRKLCEIQVQLVRQMNIEAWP